MAKTRGFAQGQLELDTSRAPPSAKRVGRGTRRSVPPAAPDNYSEATTAGHRAFVDGQRVRVKIRDRGRFSGNSAAEMDGKTGVVVRLCGASCNGDPPLGPAYLVRFDEPVPGGHADQSPVEAFWFPPGDLEAV